MSNTETELVIELLGDGGIRLAAPERAQGLATAARARQVINSAARGGRPVRITGDVESPPARAALELLAPPDAGVTIAPSTPAPWPDGWTSLQAASAQGLDDVVKDLLARGVPAGSPAPAWRRDQTPYRLAMQRGYFDVMRTLRDGGAPLPFGLSPPAELPNAVVARAYVPGRAWRLFAVAPAVFGIVVVVVGLVFGIDEAILLGSVALIIAACSSLFTLIANAMVGLARIAVDGPYLSYCQFLRWQGPIDLRRLIAIGYTRTLSPRYPSDWQLVQREAGFPYRPSLDRGIDHELVEQMKQDPTLLAIKISCARGDMDPGLPRYLAGYLRESQARLTAGARYVFAGAGVPDRSHSRRPSRKGKGRQGVES